MANKIFVLDTNIFLSDPHAMYRFGENEVVIPAVVFEEVDSKKRQPDEVGRNARVFSRIMDELIQAYPQQISTGIPLESGGVLRVELNHVSFQKMEKHFDVKNNDNRILAVALNLQAEEKEEKKSDREVVLVTNDTLHRVKADALGIVAERYENDRVVEKREDAHTGIHTITVEKHVIDTFYGEKGVSVSLVLPFVEKGKCLYPQDFCILKSHEGTSAVGRIVEQGGSLKLIPLYGKKRLFGVSPRNEEQKMYVELLMDPAVSLVCCIGRAGTGKTILALAAALFQTENEGRYHKTIVARPVIPMGKDIGYLPGEKEEKLRPWMQPIYDNLEFLLGVDEEEKKEKGPKQTVDQMIDEMSLEIEALTYIRGRSIPYQYIIIDEAQNLTPHEVKTILTRAGEGAKVVLIGDPEQIDHPYLDRSSNGLVYAMERMKMLGEVGVMTLAKTERSPLAEKAAELL